MKSVVKTIFLLIWKRCGYKNGGQHSATVASCDDWEVYPSSQ